MRTVALAFLILGVTATQPASAQVGWKAGVASTVITPKEPMWMAGYAARNKPSEGVLHELHAKALALQDETGAISVLVSAEILGFSRHMSQVIASSAQKRFGLPRERLVLNASHTHSGPVTGEVLRPAYPLDQKQTAIVQRYTAALLDQIVELIGASIRNLEPAQLSFEQGLAGFAANRRRVGARSRPGPVDHDVPVLSVRSAGGKLKAVVFGYACHNTNLSGYQFSGDYAGVAQLELEKLHPGTVALFVAGCGADANPLPRRSVELMTMYGKILAAAVEGTLAGKMKPVAGPIQAVYEEVDLPFQKPPTREELEARTRQTDPNEQRYARYLLDMLDRQGRLPERFPYPVQVWQFGRDLTFIPMAGEVVVDYALRFKAEYGWDNTWVAGYSNDVSAYIPSLRVWKEGGYEAGGAMRPYGQPAPFRSSVEEIVADKVDELVKRVRSGR